jgi:LCP family protein required for cell wall assembly
MASNIPTPPQVMPDGHTPRHPAPPLVAKGSPPRPKKSRPWRWAALIVALGAVALTGGMFYSNLKSMGGKGGALSVIDSIRNPRAQFPDKNRLNILLIGKDYSYVWVKNNIALNGSRYSSESRSDTIMMLSLDLDSGKVSALSIPRDTWVTDPKGHRGKINGTYKRGGAKLLGQTVGELLGVNPDYYVAVRPDSVKTVVDKLGGVEVETLDTMEYNDAAAGLHINLPAGRQVINGDQAIGFARFREADIYQRDEEGRPIYTGRKDSAGNPIFRLRRHVEHSKEEGDTRRMARQQQLMRALAARAKSPENWMKAGDVVDTALGQLETNLTRQQIFALVALFKNLQPDQMQTGTLPGRGVMGGTYKFVPDPDKKKALVEWLLKGDESAANRLTVVAVQNGTDVRGAARRVADRLREEGFDAKADGSAPRTKEAGTASPNAEIPITRIVYGKAAVAPRAQRIAQLLGVPATQVVKQVNPNTAGASEAPDPDAADVTIILGRDLAAANGPRSARR